MIAARDKTPVLVVDDEPAIRRLLRASLTAEGFEVIEAENAENALKAIEARKPEVMVLDLGLPDMDGADVIRRIRSSGSKLPIIVLSSRSEEREKVEALELGADDYVTKPFGIAELVARIRIALRHRFQQQGGEPVFKSGDLQVDLVHRVVTTNGKEVKLSPKEYDILRLLVLHAGKVLTHRFLVQEVWEAETDVQYLRIYVRQLRQKIEVIPEMPAHIITETGVGYRLRVQEKTRIDPTLLLRRDRNRPLHLGLTPITDTKRTKAGKKLDAKSSHLAKTMIAGETSVTREWLERVEALPGFTPFRFGETPG